MVATTLTSELEAINVLLEASDEAPVGALTLTGLYPLDKAKAILSETSRVVQAVGWAFNTEEDFPFTPDVDGNITLPGNLLQVDFDAAYPDITPVQRGTRLYDAKGHTYTFSKEVRGRVVFLLDWDDLPQAARHYITIRAARTMQGRSAISESTYRYSQDDEQVALNGLQETETSVGDHNMLRDSWSVASVLFNRELQ